MTTETVEAIFERGSFRLVDPSRFAFRDGQRVRLVVEAEPTPEMILDLAAQVYSGFTLQDITDVETIILERNDFFGDKA